jgi:hypothetical protein
VVIEQDDYTDMLHINYQMLEIFKHILFLKYFTGIELESEDLIAQYDVLKENSIFDFIYNEVNEYGNRRQLEDLDRLVMNTLEQKVKLGNSLEGIVSKNLKVVVDKVMEIDQDKVGKWIKDLTKAMSKFDPSKMEFLKSVTEKLK